MARPSIRTKEYWKEYGKRYYLAHKKEMNSQSSKYAKDNRERLNEVHKTWRRNNPESMWKYFLKYKYKLSPEQYKDIFEKQNGVCAICNGNNKRFKTLVVDHCHKKKKVRGLLCDNCNVSLGLMNESIERLENAINYLKINE